MSVKNDGRASWDANSMIENAKSLQRVAPLREGPQPRYGSPDRRRPWPGMVGGEYPDEDTGAHESWFTEPRELFRTSGQSRDNWIHRWIGTTFGL